MTIACIGDIHLSALDRYIPGAYKLVLDTLDRVFTNCVSKGISTVVLLGDISDTTHLPDHMLIAFCDLLRKHDLFYHIIVGNHDRASDKEHALNVLGWMGRAELLPVKVYNTPEIVKIDGDRYFMCPSPYVEDVPSKCRYGFGHFGFSGAKSDTGFAVKSKNEPKGRWILGDYHTPQTGKTYMYAGSITQVKFFESDEKGYIELDERPKFITWRPSIRLATKTLTSFDEIDKLDKKVYYVVNLSGDSVAPPNWATLYPNVVRLKSDKKIPKKARALLQSLRSSDVLAGLDAWLANQGATDKDIKRARRFIQ